jgi:RimJ/RimL family protein N-acetyltransferase
VHLLAPGALTQDLEAIWTPIGRIHWRPPGRAIFWHGYMDGAISSAPRRPRKCSGRERWPRGTVVHCRSELSSMAATHCTAGFTLLAMFPSVTMVRVGLEIREFGPQDAVQVAAFVATGDRTALPPGSPDDVGAVEGWLAETVHRRRLDGEGVHLAMVAVSAGEIVGSIGLRGTDWDAGHTEIGYGVQAGRRGRGHATVAARAVGLWALTDCGMRRVQLGARVDNVASLRVAEKAGYHREGTLRMAESDGEEGHDLAVFSMIATDLESAGIPD